MFIATPTSAWASAGASLVPSPVMATNFPSACSRRMRSILSLGVACARKSSTPASRAMAAAVRGLSPVIIKVRIPIARNWLKRSRMPPLTMSFSSITPSAPRVFSATTRGVPPDRAISSTLLLTSSGNLPLCCAMKFVIDSAAPLRI